MKTKTYYLPTFHVARREDNDVHIYFFSKVKSKSEAISALRSKGELINEEKFYNPHADFVKPEAISAIWYHKIS